MVRIAQAYPGETEAEARARLRAIRGDLLDDEARKIIAEQDALDAEQRIINNQK